MASDKSFADYILEQIQDAGEVSSIKMFGEYGVYCDGKIVALVCDNQFYVKPTGGGRSFIGNPVEAAPYPGAKPYFLIKENLEDPDWMSELIKITANELPVSKKKRK